MSDPLTTRCTDCRKEFTEAEIAKTGEGEAGGMVVMAGTGDSMTDPMFVIYQCPAHPHFVTPCIDRADGTGTRMFSGKCCPRQYAKRLVGWRLTQQRRDEMVEEMDAALEASHD